MRRPGRFDESLSLKLSANAVRSSNGLEVLIEHGDSLLFIRSLVPLDESSISMIFRALIVESYN